MADNYTLDAQARSITGKKVSQLRNQGLVPAVVYGEAVQPVHVQIPYRALEVALMKAGGTHLITLSVEGQAHTVITRDVQRDILKGKITHVDFLAVSATTKLKTEVPVHFFGEAPAIALRVGVLNTVTPYVEVEALPADLIDHIDVDLSSLKVVGDAIHVRDLKLSDKVVAVTDEDTVIVAVGAIGAGATEEPVEGEVTSSEPEVIQKGKIEEDEE